MTLTKSQSNRTAPGRQNRDRGRNDAAKFPTIALLIESSRASGRALLCGIARCIHHHGPISIFWEPGGLEKAWPKLRTLDVNGIILRDVDKLDEVLDLGIPAVVVGHSKTEISGMVNVVTDSAAIGRMAAEHLIQCGFKNFGYCGFAGTPWSDLRRKSFGDNIRKAGFQFYDYTVLAPSANAWQSERREMANWLRALPKPAGVMACNDDCGHQVIEACKRAGLAVPDAIGVLGADNDEVVCGLTEPPMSSVAINFERAGYEAALVLFRLLRGKYRVPPIIKVHATHIVGRRSTEIIAVSDSQVGRAMQFVRDHAKENLMVMDVSRAAALSRRTLEKRFRHELQCSVHKYIRQVRTERIARLLIETELPVARIAEDMGFPDIQHFARYFRAEKQMSPLAYRKTHGKRVG